MSLRFYTLLSFCLLLSGFAWGQNLPERIITDAALRGNTTYNWVKDTVYILDGYVFLEAGGVLNIAPGTVIKGRQDASNGVDGTSALIITRDARIFADGTAEEPIIFTSEFDDLNDDTDMELPDAAGKRDDRGSWGGIIVLGRGEVGEDGGEEGVEGIPSEELRARYGGGASPNNAESSGVLRYLSLRYGGDALTPDNEINGLTLGGVGSGTIIEYVEVFGNLDDGFEMFGGAVNLRYCVAAFCGDESFDSDESWSGNGQFWFGIQLPNDPSGNEQFAGEHDGSEAADLQPRVTSTVYNATYIGMGIGQGNGQRNTALQIRRDAAFSYNNSIFTEFADEGLRLRDSSETRYVAGAFAMRNNIWFGFGKGNAPAQFVISDSITAQVIAKLLAEGNEAVSPNLGGISRIADGGLDPRPNAGSPALINAVDPVGDFFEATGFRGAFANNDNWAEGWSNLDYLGYFGNLVMTSTIDFGRSEAGVVLQLPAPNPATTYTQLQYELPEASEVAIYVFDMTGRPVQQQALGYQVSGANVHNLSVQGMPAGQYVIALRTAFGTVTQLLTLIK